MRSFAVNLLFHLSSYKWSNLCTLPQTDDAPRLFSHTCGTRTRKEAKGLLSPSQALRRETLQQLVEECAQHGHPLSLGQSPDRPVYAGTDSCLAWRHLCRLRNVAMGLALLLKPQKAEHPVNYSLSFHICS